MQDLSARLTGRRGFVTDPDTVQDDVFGELEEVFGRDEITAMNDGSRAGGINKGEAGTRTAAEIKILRFAGATDQLNGVAEENLAHMDALDGLHGGDEIFSRTHRSIINHIEGRPWDGTTLFLAQAHAELALEDVLFFIATGISQTVEEHKPVQLGLGELKGAGLFDRSLCGNHEERRG